MEYGNSDKNVIYNKKNSTNDNDYSYCLFLISS